MNDSRRPHSFSMGMGLVAALPLQRLVKGDTALQRKVQRLHMANEGAEDSVGEK
ncbi:hypothetical protein WN944_018988 [Citrus x changshan-huyou]|uniref:Uncharacterized protein n=1 Tax=Citrus x changshan-huyou TaxID=2935761 RepID=A0AAP0LUM2_9ROSI